MKWYCNVANSDMLQEWYQLQLLARPKCYLLSKLNIDVCGVLDAHLFLCPILKQGVAIEAPANRSLSPLAAVWWLSPGWYAPCRFLAWLAGAAGVSTCQLTGSVYIQLSIAIFANCICRLYIAICQLTDSTVYSAINSI